MDAHATGLLLVVAGWSGVVALMVWIYRRRRAARERARDERYRQIIGVTLAARAGSAVADLAAAGGVPAERAPNLAARHATRSMPPLGAASARTSAGPGSGGDEGARSVGVPPVAGARFMPPPAAGAGSPPGATDAREQALRMADALLGLRPGGGAPSPAAQAPANAVVAMRPRAPLLDTASRAMLLALRAAAPGHEVLIGPSLARLLDAPPGLSGVDRSLRLRQASALAVDFAVCTRALGLVATIDLVGQGMPASERDLRRAAAALLETAGVRHFVFDPAQLPRYPDLRAMIGLDTPGEGA